MAVTRAEWVKTQHALEILGISWSSGRKCKLLRGLPQREAPSIEGVSGRRATLYRRADIERAARIADECSIPAAAAIRVVAAEREGRI